MESRDREKILKEISEAKKTLESLEKKFKEEMKMEDKEEKLDIREAKDIVATLDEIASMLEEEGSPECMKLAFEIDRISDELEGKSAAALKYDKDELYMKDYFKGGVIEKDEDENYLKSFDTDVSSEVRKNYERSKEASLPYEILS